MNQNQDLKTFLETLQGEEAKAFLRFMKDQADAGASAEDACMQYAASKGYHVTADQIDEIEGAVQLSADDLENVAGGTCFTAGTPSQDRLWSCPTDCRNKYLTGNEKEEPLFFFWSRHMKEYHCPDCNSTWWEHED